MKRIANYAVVALFASLGPFLTSCSSAPAPKPATQLKPTVIIQNRTNHHLMIGIRKVGEEGSPRFVSISAHGNETIRLASSAYKYAAASKNVKTISGYKHFSSNKRYTWKFDRN